MMKSTMAKEATKRPTASALKQHAWFKAGQVSWKKVIRPLPAIAKRSELYLCALVGAEQRISVTCGAQCFWSVGHVSHV